MQSDSANKTAEQKTIVQVTKEKRTSKKVVVPPKSQKHPKPKRGNFLIKKLKLKGKSLTPTSSASASSQQVESTSETSLPAENSFPEQPHIIPEVIVESSPPTERQTPEGNDDSLMITKSVSDTNLCKNTENLENTAAKTEVETSTSSKNKDFGGGGRTKSLETLKEMPAYGDLIIDSSTANTSYANKPTERKDHLYKIIVIGDLGSGKTSIIKRYVHRFFTQNYRATVGVDFALKVLNWDENTFIRLQLWDIAGQERYGNMTRVYYKEAVGAFIVFDVTRTSTFESVAKWKSDLDSKVLLADGSPIPCVLLANKCDQAKEGLVTNPSKMDEYAREHGFITWFETSAKDNINIDEAARALVSRILELDVLNSESSRDSGDKLTLSSNAQKNGKTCSC